MNNLAIIPARGGSKRIPKKNIKDFLGKPIIAYSIEVAIKSGLFNEIMVSTNDMEIASISKEYGANVPFFRSDKASNDYAVLADVIEEVKMEYQLLGKFYDYICLILPTAPLIKLSTLRRGFNLLVEKSNIDSIRPVIRYSYPIQRANKMVDGALSLIQPEYMYTRSQDLEPSFYDAGQFYWMRSSTGLRGDRRFGFEIPYSEAQDIDDEDDWQMAIMKYQFHAK